MNVFDVKKYPLGNFPTPLERMSNLEKYLGVPNLFIKRDDLNGLGLAGNKVRKLEYLVQDAMDQGCTALLTYGGPQTNHGRLTVAAAVKCGMKAILILDEERPDYCSGNLILDELMGADLYFTAADPKQKAREVMAEYEKRGEKVYEIAPGGSSEIGALGYFFMMQELGRQLKEQDIHPRYLVASSGSLGTFSGMWLGAKYFNVGLEVVPVAVDPLASCREVPAADLINRTSKKYGLGLTCTPEELKINLSYAGLGYNIPDADTQEAMRILASTEAIFVDPCYTGKSFRGYLDLVQNVFAHGDGAIYLHTGGIPAIWTKEHLDSMQDRFWNKTR